MDRMPRTVAFALIGAAVGVWFAMGTLGVIPWWVGLAGFVVVPLAERLIPRR